MIPADDGRRATLLCWNVAGRVRKLAEQQARVVDLDPDLICLQETSVTTAVAWRERLADVGWPHSAVADAADAKASGRARPLLALVAARTPLERIDTSQMPWPERVLAVRVDRLEVVNVHSPTDLKSELAKVVTHELVAAHMVAGTGPRLVCGDLNTPRREHPDGRVWTFARDRYGRLLKDRGERWDQAELALIKGLEPHGFRDAFRSLNGPFPQESTWELPRGGGGHRIDHLVSSAEVHASYLSYLHEWRREGLSDHSPLYAQLHW